MTTLRMLIALSVVNLGLFAEEVHLAVVTMLNAIVRAPVANAKSVFSTPRFGSWKSDDLSERG